MTRNTTRHNDHYVYACLDRAVRALRSGNSHTAIASVRNALNCIHSMSTRVARIDRIFRSEYPLHHSDFQYVEFPIAVDLGGSHVGKSLTRLRAVAADLGYEDNRVEMVDASDAIVLFRALLKESDEYRKVLEKQLRQDVVSELGNDATEEQIQARENEMYREYMHMSDLHEPAYMLADSMNMQ